MKVNTLGRCTAIMAAALCTLPAIAQDNIENILNENISDSKKIIGEYVAPFMKSVTVGLNQGWYNTAATHKTLGVDLTITTGLMIIPDKETVFNVNDLGLQSLSLDRSSEGYPFAPTAFGNDDEPVFRHNETGRTFKGAPGMDLKAKVGKNMMPVPMAHIGIGLPKGTDLKVRFIPSIDLNGDGEFKMWGVGVMHDVKQHIPGIKLLPFDLSAFIGYTKFNMEYRAAEGEVDGENQRQEFNMSATTVQAIVSKKLSVFTFYGGLGYNMATSNLGVKGTYDLNNDGDYADSYEVNPLDFRYSASGPRATAGLRIKLSVITLHADYTFQKYKALTAGIGICVR
jgi:hypothetical protein